MKQEEGHSARLWLEKQTAQDGLDSTQPVRPLIKHIKIDTATMKIAQPFLTSHHLKWDELLSGAWARLLQRFSASDNILFAATSITKHGQQFYFHQNLTPVKTSLNEQTTLKQYLTHITSQIHANKKPKTASQASDIRYLIAKISQAKKIKASNLVDMNQFSLILLFDKIESKQMTILYHPLLFDKNTIDSLSENLLTAIQQCCAKLTTKVCRMDVLTEDDREKILKKWHKPRYGFTTHSIDICTHQLLARHHASNPDKIAVTHNNEKLTYAELDDYSTALANHLIKKGLRPQDNIAVLMERTPDLLIAMMAIFKCGAVYVPIHPKYPDERIEFIIDDCQAKFILINENSRLPHQFDNLAMTVSKNRLQASGSHDPKSLPPANIEYIAYIIYTSGTTGNPKGVMICHQSLANFTAWYVSCFQVTAEDRASQFASQGFDTFLCETIPILSLGASVHIVDDNIKLTPALFFEWLRNEKITICDLPTVYAQMLFFMEWPKPISLRLVKIGGEAITRYPEQLFSFDIWNTYGPTETTIEATYFKIYDAKRKHYAVCGHSAPPIGKPIANAEAYIVDKYLLPVPISVAGELLIGGPGVSPGYLHRDEQTQARFIRNLFHPDSPYPLYRTGDLACWLPDGNIEFIGRLDHQVKIRGYRVELGDIENSISQHPDVNEVIVLAKEELNGEKSLIAYVVPNLDKERYLYQERCLFTMDNNTFFETITEDISKYGVSISGLSTPIETGHKVYLRLKLPGFNDSKTLGARVIWQLDNRCGLVFDMNDETHAMVAKSIDYYLSMHNVMELVLSASAKRSLRKALRKKLPEYMVPPVFVTLLQFPLTFSGKIDVKALPPPSDFEKILQKQFVPPKTLTEKSLALIWSGLVGKEQISLTDNFFDLGGNSLLAAELSVKIMNQFNISIPANILFDLSFIPILAEYIDSKGLHYSTQSDIQNEIQRDCILQDNINLAKHASPRLHKPEHILLTGAGGFLGIYLLRELLKQTDAKIYCLIRKGDFESAAKRLTATVHKFQLENEVSLTERRIIAIPSDISFDHFGLPQEQYKSLAEKVDMIFHCGAQVNIMASYHKLRGSNVDGTLEVIKFATQYVNKPIHYISTLSSAYLKDAAGCLTEAFPTETYEDFFGGYAISKWVSERLLTLINHRGLPISIYRSGYIFGDSKSGISSLNDALLMLIKGCMQLGYAPSMHEKITVLPVDFVSRAITGIALAQPDASMVYHIDHPTGIMWSDLVAWLNQQGYQIKIIPTKDWKIMLKQITRDNALYPFLPYYLGMPDDQKSPEVSTQHAADALSHIHLPYPDINHDFLLVYLNYLQDVNFFPAPASV